MRRCGCGAAAECRVSHEGSYGLRDTALGLLSQSLLEWERSRDERDAHDSWGFALLASSLQRACDAPGFILRACVSDGLCACALRRVGASKLGFRDERLEPPLETLLCTAGRGARGLCARERLCVSVRCHGPCSPASWSCHVSCGGLGRCLLEKQALFLETELHWVVRLWRRRSLVFANKRQHATRHTAARGSRALALPATLATFTPLRLLALRTVGSAARHPGLLVRGG
jgi:hypothetical protein